jgi:TolB protein
MRCIRPCAVAVPVLLGVSLALPATATPPGKNGQLIWQQESRTKPPGLLVANPDGSGQRKVFPIRNQAEFEGTFSPTDSNNIAFSRGVDRPFSERVYIGNLATGAVTKLRTGKLIAVAPTFSSDGRRIAFFGAPIPKNRKGDPGKETIYIVNVDGTGLRRVTSRSRASIDPDFSPDGTRLVYAETRQVGKNRFQNRIAVIGVNGKNRRTLTRYGGREEINPKWMPDGKRIAFERAQRRGRPIKTRSDIVTMDVSGKDVKTVLATKAFETNPIPSPDGTRIAFTSDRDRRGKERLGPGFELYTVKTDGSDIVRVTNNRIPDIFPDWQRLP